MRSDLRKTGISMVGDMPWGTHFCHFYETQQDLLDIFIPYLKAGLENNEFCMWVTTKPLSEATRNSLRHAIPGFDGHLAAGDLEILLHTQWYLRDGIFDPQRVAKGWFEKLAQALAKGYAGLRVAADEAWLGKKYWQAFAEYEKELDEPIANERMVVMCAYPLVGCEAAAIFDVTRTHQFAIAERQGHWETLETPELKHTKAELKALNDRLEQRVADRTKELEMRNEALRQEIAERRRVEEALRESEKLYRLLTDNMNELIYLLDLEGHFVYASPSVGRLLGRDSTQLANVSQFERIHPEDLEVAQRAWEEVIDGKPVSFTCRFLHSDGTWRWLEAVAVLIQYRGEPHVFAVSRDITARVRMEEQLRKQARMNDALFDQAITCFVLLDRDYKFIRVNEAWASNFRKKVEDFQGRNYFDLFPQDQPHRGEDRALLDEVLRTKKPLRTTARPVVFVDQPERGITFWDWIIQPILDERGEVEFLFFSAIDVTERKQAETALREAHENYVTLVHSIDGIVWQADAQTLAFSFVSDQAERLLGYPVERWLAEPSFWRDHLHPDDREWAVNFCFSQIQEKHSHTFEYRMLAADGRIVWLRDSVTVTTEQDRPIRVQGIMVDITKRKQSEEALEISEARLQAAIDAANIGLWDWDQISGQIIWLGHHARMFGFAPGEFDGTYASFEKRILPKDLEGLNRAVQHARDEKSEYAHEYRVIWPDGSVHWIAGRGKFMYNEMGQPVRMYGAVIDITERKRAEAALRQSEFYLAEAQKISHTGSWAWDVAKQEFVHYSEEHYRMYGLDPANGIPSWEAAQQLIHPEDRAEVFAKIETAIRERKDSILDYRAVLPDGSIKHIHSIGHPKFNESGELVEFVGTEIDVTKRRQAEEAVKESEERLRLAFEAANFGTGELDLQTNQTNFSSALQQVLGFAPGTFNPTLEGYVERVHPEDRDIVRQAVENGIAGQPEISVDYRIVWPDGSIHWVTSRAKVFYDATGKATRIVGALMDITELKQAEELIRQQSARSQLLADLSRTFAEVGLDYQSVLNMVAKRTAELIGDLCVIILFSKDGQPMTTDAIHHPDPRALELIQAAFRQDWQGNRQRVRKLLSNKPLYLPVVDPEQFRPTQDPVFWPYFDEIGMSSILCVPLQIQGKVIGTLSIIRDRGGRPYTPEDQAYLQDIADRAALTIQNARLFEQAQASQERLRVLSQRLVDVQESEQRRLAREIHDDISQTLTALMLQLGTAKNLLPKSAQTVYAILEQSEELTEETMEHTRSIIAGLRLQVLDDLGLVPALRRLGAELHENTGVRVEMKISRLPKRLPSSIEAALFRIIQEALANIRKHAHAQHVIVTLAKEGKRVVLSVQDDGVGFKMQTHRSRASGDMVLNGGLVIPAGHFGLIGIQEQVTPLGGTFQMYSAPGEGTSIQVELPL